MLDNILNFVLQFIVIFLDKLKTILLVSLELLVDLQNPSDLLFLCRNNRPQNFKVVVVVCPQIGLPLAVDLPLLGKLIVIETRQILYPLPVSVVIILQLVPQIAVVVDQPGNLTFSLLPSPLQLVISLLNFVFLLLNLVRQPLDLGLMQILQLILVFLVLPYQVALDVFVFGLDQVDFMGFLLLKFLQLVFAIIRLHRQIHTSDFSSSFLSLICLFKFSISKFFSSMASFNFLIFSS